MTSCHETVVTRERALHALYEAAELEHNLMCTTFTPRSASRTASGKGSRRMSRGGRPVAAELIRVRSRKCSTSPQCGIYVSPGRQPRFGRTNFPLDPVTCPLASS